MSKVLSSDPCSIFESFKSVVLKKELCAPIQDFCLILKILAKGKVKLKCTIFSTFLKTYNFKLGTEVLNECKQVSYSSPLCIL